MNTKEISSQLYKALNRCTLPEKTFRKWPEHLQKQRNLMTGVYHDNGTIVASDAFVMVLLKGFSYPEEYEKKSINPDFELIEGKYPNYTIVIPSKNSLTEYGSLNHHSALLNVCKLIPKSEGTEPTDIIPFCLLNAAFNPVQVERVAQVLDLLGESPVQIFTGPHSNYGQMVLKTKSCTALVMGLYGGANAFKEHYTIEEILATGDIL